MGDAPNRRCRVVHRVAETPAARKRRKRLERRAAQAAIRSEIKKKEAAWAAEKEAGRRQAAKKARAAGTYLYSPFVPTKKDYLSEKGPGDGVAAAVAARGARGSIKGRRRVKGVRISERFTRQAIQFVFEQMGMPEEETWVGDAGRPGVICSGHGLLHTMWEVNAWRRKRLQGALKQIIVSKELIRRARIASGIRMRRRRKKKSGKKDKGSRWARCRLAQVEQFLAQLFSRSGSRRRKIKRLEIDQILFLDEKHFKVILGCLSKWEYQAPLNPEDAREPDPTDDSRYPEWMDQARWL